MGLIGTLVSFSAGTQAKSSEVNANFAAIRTAFNSFAVLTDVAKTISVKHTVSAQYPLDFTHGDWADGAMGYMTSNGLTGLPKGTARQLLQMNAGATAPAWTDQVNLGSSGILTIGSPAASVGNIRLANAMQVNWRNAANSGDVRGLRVDGTDRVFVGDSGAVGVTIGAASIPTTVTGAFLVTSAGPHAVGAGAVVGYVGFLHAGTFTSDASSNIAVGMRIQRDVIGAAGDTTYHTQFQVAGGTMTTQPGETVNVVASAWFREPDITVGAAGTVTEGATVYIESAPTEGSSTNWALDVNQGNVLIKNGTLSVRQPGVAFSQGPLGSVELHYNTSTGLATLSASSLSGTTNVEIRAAQSGTSAQIALFNGSELSLTVPGFVRGDHLIVTDGVSAPTTTAGRTKIYVDSADGDLKVKFGDGTVKTLATDT